MGTKFGGSGHSWSKSLQLHHKIKLGFIASAAKFPFTIILAAARCFVDISNRPVRNYNFL